MAPLLRKEARGGGIAATSKCFVPFRHDQRTEPVWRLCDRPLEAFARSRFKLYGAPALAGRGGSVSRRDHNPATGNRAQLSGGAIFAETYTSNASCSSGGSAREGKGSHSRRWRLSMAVFLNRNKRPSAAPIEVAEASCKEAASPGVLSRHSSTILGFSRLGRYMTKRRPMH